MSTLSSVKATSALRLRAYSDQTLSALKGKALDCMVELHKHGSTVQQVTVRRDHVTLEIDQPGQWLRGAMHVTRVNGRYREIVMVASVLGCQVQWIEREEHLLLRRNEDPVIRIHFEDQGQDFLHWDVDANGFVVDAQPFQREAWRGCRVLRHMELRNGDRIVYLSNDGTGTHNIKHPVINVEPIGGG